MDLLSETVGSEGGVDDEPSVESDVLGGSELEIVDGSDPGVRSVEEYDASTVDSVMDVVEPPSETVTSEVGVDDESAVKSDELGGSESEIVDGSDPLIKSVGKVDASIVDSVVAVVELPSETVGSKDDVEDDSTVESDVLGGSEPGIVDESDMGVRPVENVDASIVDSVVAVVKLPSETVGSEDDVEDESAVKSDELGESESEIVDESDPLVKSVVKVDASIVDSVVAVVELPSETVGSEDGVDDESSVESDVRGGSESEIVDESDIGVRPVENVDASIVDSVIAVVKLPSETVAPKVGVDDESAVDSDVLDESEPGTVDESDMGVRSVEEYEASAVDSLMDVVELPSETVGSEDDVEDDSTVESDVLGGSEPEIVDESDMGVRSVEEYEMSTGYFVINAVESAV